MVVDLSLSFYYCSIVVEFTWNEVMSHIADFGMHVWCRQSGLRSLPATKSLRQHWTPRRKKKRKKKGFGGGIEHITSIDWAPLQTEEVVKGCPINVLNNLQAHAISNIISRHTLISPSKTSTFSCSAGLWATTPSFPCYLQRNPLTHLAGETSMRFI